VHLEDVDVAHPDAGRLECCLAGVVHQVPTPDLAAAVIPEPARTQRAAPDGHVVCATPGGADDRGRGGVADRAALQDRQRIGDHPRAEHLLGRDRPPARRPGVARAVAVVLHRHRGELLGRGVELVEIPGGGHAVDGGHRHALQTLPIGLLGEDGAGEGGGHRLDPDREDPLVAAEPDDLGRLVQRGRAAGAGVLDRDDRDAGDARGLQATLQRAGAAEHGAREHRVDAGYPRVIEGLGHRRPNQLRSRAFGCLPNMLVPTPLTAALMPRLRRTRDRPARCDR
jgi:hypothetical protein